MLLLLATGSIHLELAFTKCRYTKVDFIRMHISMIARALLSQDLKLFLLKNLVYREIHLQSIDFVGVQALQDHSRRTQETAV
jgi:hypothetical protein